MLLFVTGNQSDYCSSSHVHAPRRSPVRVYACGFHSAVFRDGSGHLAFSSLLCHTLRRGQRGLFAESVWQFWKAVCSCGSAARAARLQQMWIEEMEALSSSDSCDVCVFSAWQPTWVWGRFPAGGTGCLAARLCSSLTAGAQRNGAESRTMWTATPKATATVEPAIFSALIFT